MSGFLRSKIEAFRSSESGTIVPFTTMIFSLMVLSAGMGVDFMRQETMRAELQDALDRGVLAATAVGGTKQTAEATIREYMKSTNFLGTEYELDVTVAGGNNDLKTYAATAKTVMRTSFLRLAGIPSIDVNARSAAVEGINLIELSLVLDVSTSMSYETTGGTTNSRLEIMKVAAQQFIDQALAIEAKKGVSISLVPFAGQVNPGPVAYNRFVKNSVHGYSHCFEFTDADFAETDLPNVNSRDQMQYFQFSIPFNSKNGVTYPEIGWGWCPAAGEEEIVYHSGDATALKTAIENLNTHEATGTQIGMKWGVALLDKRTSGLTGNLVAANQVDPKFAHRPVSSNASYARKFIVVMSDGDTTGQVRLWDNKYDTAAERDFYANNLSTSQWADFNMNHQSRDAARAQFLQQCTLAKEAGIVVFTIGFDIADGSNAQTDMAACASTPSHFYDVDGLDLVSAFSSIAQTIQKLKLTQ